MPKEKYFSRALYTFDIGQNDLTIGFSNNTTIEQAKDSVADIVNNFTTHIKVANHSLIYYFMNDKSEIFIKPIKMQWKRVKGYLNTYIYKTNLLNMIKMILKVFDDILSSKIVFEYSKIVFKIY